MFCRCFGTENENKEDDFGELSTGVGAKKKKTKSKDDDVIVGGTFRVQSEFASSSSRFKSTPALNEAVKMNQNGTSTTSTSTTSKPSQSQDKPKNWCGTQVPTGQIPPPKDGYTADDSERKPIQPIQPTQPTENGTVPKQLKSNLKKPAPVPPTETKVNQEKVSDQNVQKSIQFSLPPEEPKETKSTFETVKIKLEETKATENKAIKTEDSDESEDEFGAKKNPIENKNEIKTNDQGKKFITIGGFDDNKSESEDEYETKKSPTNNKTQSKDEYETKKPSTKSESKVESKQPEESRKSDDYGYSNQAASIFFRSDSPEPEQRVRNFSIKKGNDDDDDTASQTSA